MTSSEVATIEAAPVEHSGAIGQLMQHAEAMSAAHRLGTVLAESDLAPKDYKGKPGNAAVAILYGAELGLSPIQSIQQIFVVHGRPAIYARTMVALIKTRGYTVQTVESTDESVTVTGFDPRTGLSEPSTWTIERATKAGYVPTVDEKTGAYKVNQYGKLIGNEKYLTDPQGMLYAKAAAEVCRKIAPEVLLGIPYSREDLESEQEPVKTTAERIGGGVAGLRGKLGLDPSPVAPEPSKPEQKPDAAQVTDAQLKELGGLMRDSGLTDPAAALAWTTDVIGHEIASSADLTAAEAVQLIAKLNEAAGVAK